MAVPETDLITVKVDKAQLARVERMLQRIPRQFPRVMARALNKTATTVRSKTVKAAAAETGVKQKTLRRNTFIRRARFRNLVAVVILKQTRIPAVELSARQTRRGVTIRTGKGRREVLRHAFITTMPTGHRGVFRRLGQTRLPIKEWWAKGFLTALEPVLPVMLREADRLLVHYTNQQVLMVLRKESA